MTVVKRVGVMSAGKILAVIYAFIGLLAGGMFSLISVMGAVASRSGGGGIAPLVFSAGAVIVMPILYGVIGFISGLLFAAIYNAAASAIGGIELELGPTESVGFPVSRERSL